MTTIGPHEVLLHIMKPDFKAKRGKHLYVFVFGFRLNYAVSIRPICYLINLIEVSKFGKYIYQIRALLFEVGRPSPQLLIYIFHNSPVLYETYFRIKSLLPEFLNVRPTFQ